MNENDDIELDAEGAEAEGQGNFTPFPAGEYLLVAKEAKTGPTKDQRRRKTELKCEVVDGQYAGRLIWTTLTWIPKGEPGHGIALSALKAMGLPYDGSLRFSAQDLVNRPFKAQVIIDAEYDPSKPTNKVKKFISDQEMLDQEQEFAGGKGEQAPPTRPAAAPARAAAPPVRTPAPVGGAGKKRF